MKLPFSLILTLIFSYSVFCQQSENSKNKSADSKTAEDSAVQSIDSGGRVEVKVTIDEKGNVVSAKAVRGTRELYKSSVEAALKSKFNPTILGGQAVPVTGIIVYNYLPETGWESVGGHLGSIEDGIFSKTVSFDSNDPIWKNFKEEKAEYLSILANPSAQEKIARASRLNERIREKLVLSDPEELWRFNLGVVVSKLKNAAESPDKAADFQMYLQELALMLNTHPNDFPQKRLENLTEAAKFSESENLNEEKRKEIIKLLTENSENVSKEDK